MSALYEVMTQPTGYCEAPLHDQQKLGGVRRRDL